MMTDRAALLERCLRLEARLLGVEVTPPEPMPATPPVDLRAPRTVRARHYKVKPVDVFIMGELRANGLSYREISRRVGFSEGTVRRYVGAR